MFSSSSKRQVAHFDTSLPTLLSQSFAQLYVREEIAWSFIDFNDNQPCIELIEGKLGLLDLLDEECRMPSGNDGSFATKILKAQREPAISKFFGKPRFGSDSFIVHHFAYSVAYDVDGFVDKNRDTIGEEQLMLLQNSSFAFCRDLFAPLSTVLVASGTRKGKQTLGAIFKGSLAQLMETINSTNAHYIRCIKPNEAKVPDSFDNVYILQQLRACGILETIRISCAGYPGRWSYAEFNDR
jgi:myosin-5